MKVCLITKAEPRFVKPFGMTFPSEHCVRRKAHERLHRGWSIKGAPRASGTVAISKHPDPLQPRSASAAAATFRPSVSPTGLSPTSSKHMPSA